MDNKHTQNWTILIGLTAFREQLCYRKTTNRQQSCLKNCTSCRQNVRSIITLRIQTHEDFAQVIFALSRNFSRKNKVHAGINIQRKEVTLPPEDDVVHAFALSCRLPTPLTDRPERGLWDVSRITRPNSCYYLAPHIYRMSHETSTKRLVVIQELILSEKCYVNMGRNLNRYATTY
jgi:hypothetical protein